MKKLTLGSLFDGAGTFPLGALMADIQPIWSSEIEPFAIRVTTKRLPFVKHYGDIREIHGGRIEPVDIISFSSPCQDLSLAGKRKGLNGERSGLFFEAIRIIKEMRCATNGKYPRFIVWENVTGAFSSSNGRDFQSVLSEIVRIKEPQAPDVPMPEMGWATADILMGDGFSVAYRVFDSQGWGVPQRRRRIYLVADFGGQCAGKILFDAESVLGDIATRFKSWQGTADSIKVSVGTTSAGFCTEGAARCRSIGYEEEKSPTLREGIVPAAVILNDHGGERMDIAKDIVPTLRAKSNHPPLVYENHANDSRIKPVGDIAPTLSARLGTGGNNQPLVQSFGISSYNSNAMRSDNPNSGIYKSDTARTLDKQGGSPSSHQGGIAIVSRGIGRDTFNCGKNAKFGLSIDEELQPTMTAKGPGAVQQGYTVRRLTPTECARLQGFPDWWCDNLETENPTEEEMGFWRVVFKTQSRIIGTKEKSDKQIRKWLKNPHSDSAEYRMWGNGCALPVVFYVLSGIARFA